MGMGSIPKNNQQSNLMDTIKNRYSTTSAHHKAVGANQTMIDDEFIKEQILNSKRLIETMKLDRQSKPSSGDENNPRNRNKLNFISFNQFGSK